MSSPNKVAFNNGNSGLTLSSKVTALNPNAAEFVPSSFRSTIGGSAVADANKSDVSVSSGKTVLDRSESSKSNNSDEEAHQFWHRQLPDDIIPDFTAMENIEQETEGLSLAGLSLNAPPFFRTAANNLLRECQEFSQARKNQELGRTNLQYDDNPQAAFSALGSTNLEQNYVDNLHFTDGNLDIFYNMENNACFFFDSSSSEYAAVTDAIIDPLEYLASEFPGFSAESLAELYYANGCNINLSIEILTQLEMQVDASSHRNPNLNPTSPNFSTADFPALPTIENQNGLFKGNTDVCGIVNGRSSSIISSGTGDFVSAVCRLASQDAGHWKFEKKSSEYGNGISSVVPKQYSSSTKPSFGNKFQTAGNARATPVWLETGGAVANMYAESRGEAHDFAHIRNTCFEQAKQAYLVGNKVLAKELSMKRQLYNMQMKAEKLFIGRGGLAP